MNIPYFLFIWANWYVLGFVDGVGSLNGVCPNENRLQKMKKGRR